MRLLSNATKWDGFWWMAGVVAVLAVGCIFSWVFWKDLRGENESLSTTLRNLGLIIGGAIAIILAVWRSRVAERQASAAQAQAATAQAQFTTAQAQADIAQRSFLNERYHRGVEMLGSPTLSARLDGIFTLRRLSEEYPEQYHVQVLLRLCAFVRNPVEYDSSKVLFDIDTEPPHRVPPPREDVQAIMDVIGSRRKEKLILESKARFRLNLRGSDLRGVNLSGANLYCAPWENITGLTLAEQLAVPPNTDFSNAQLCSARLSLADIQKADFTSACLCDAWMTLTDLSGANLSGANLHRALSWGPILSGTSLNRGRPAKGIEQSDFELCQADPGDLPFLAGVHDVETGELLVWSGKPLGDGK